MFFKRKQQSRNFNAAATEQGSVEHGSLGQSGRLAANEPSVIAVDLVVTGQVRTQGELHINGTVKGTVEAHTCVVEAEGQIDGDVRAVAIYVHGRINGPLYASHVHVFPNAIVRGDIVHDTISIENGADVLGQFLRHQSQPAPSAHVSRDARNHAPVLTTDDIESSELFETIFQNDGAQNDSLSPLIAVQPKSLRR
jgi:cytoskeletal protein CcmA (bactofilin family)